MKQELKFIILTFWGLLILTSCNHRKKMMEDSKLVFQKEQFINFQPKCTDGIESLFQLITDSINSVIPLNEKEASFTRINENGEREKKSYKWMNDCKTIKITALDSIISSQNKSFRKQLKEEIIKIDSTILKEIQICNHGLNKPPRIDITFKGGNIKGQYSHHLLYHKISNYERREPKDEIEGILEELIKLKKMSNGPIALEFHLKLEFLIKKDRS
jgi:hypothetical protein